MAWQKPEPAVVWRAVTTYLTVCYGGTPGPNGVPASTPSAIKARLDSLRHAPATEFYASPVFERDASTSTNASAPAKFSLRLGNRHYPHMKRVIERSPDGRGHLLRADTHDAHVRPAPGSRDYAVFIQLMELNRQVADQIEAAWEELGIPTFKSFLREDLARRKQGQ
jgi:hypothetical protein